MPVLPVARVHVAHLWDNGAAPSEELLRYEVRKQALAQFGIHNIKTGEALSQLEEKLVPLYLFHRYQVEAVAKTNRRGKLRVRSTW